MYVTRSTIIIVHFEHQGGYIIHENSIMHHVLCIYYVYHTDCTYYQGMYCICESCIMHHASSVKQYYMRSGK